MRLIVLRRLLSTVLFAIPLSLSIAGCGDDGPSSPEVVPQRLVVVTPPPATARSGEPFATAVVVQLADDAGRPARRAGVRVTVSSITGVTVEGTTEAMTSADGRAVFPAIVLKGLAADWSLVFTAEGLRGTDAVVVRLTAGAPVALVRVSGDDVLHGALGAPLPEPPSVRVVDAQGNGVAGILVDFAVTSGGGSVVGTERTTDTAGVATVGGWTLGGTRETNTLTARTRDARVTAPVTFTGMPHDAAFRVRAVAVGGTHVCALATDGLASCWGRNDFGQLGTGSAPATCRSVANHPSPTPPKPCTTVPLPTAGGRTYASITAGWMHTCALTPDGVAYCWGNSWSSQLGTGEKLGASVPTAVATDARFATISAGMLHTCALTGAGVAYCWGERPASMSGGVAIDLVPTLVPSDITFTRIAAGQGQTCALATDGSVYCWGWTIDGVRETPTRVEGGRTFTSLAGSMCGLTDADAAWCWGFNTGGELGTSLAPDRCEPWSFACSRQPIAVEGGPYTQLASGYSSDGRCALTAAGAAFCWGDASSGQLGARASDLDVCDRPNPIPGGKDPYPCSRRPVAVIGGHAFAGIARGPLSTCALTREDGTLYCWGATSTDEQYALTGDGAYHGATVPVRVLAP